MNGGMSLMDVLWDWSVCKLGMALNAGACAGMLAGVVLIINALFRRWISARQMAWLWGLVLLRLLIPVAPSSSFSVQNLVTMTARSGVIQNAASDPSAAADAIDVAYAASDSQVPAAIEKVPPIGERLLSMLPWAWLFGGAGFLSWTAIIHWRFCRKLKRATQCTDQNQRRLWEECCKEVGLRRRVPLLLFDGVRQPAVFGLFRPRLLLPVAATDLSDQQLRMVMLHELAHVRRWHLAANWVLVVIRAIHWWNPVYWLAATRFRNLREQSCDAFAIRQIEGQPIREYGELLLTLAQSQRTGSSWNVMLPASILGFLSSFLRKRAIGNRLKALRSAGVTRGRWHTAAVVMLGTLVGVSGSTDASTPEAPPDHSSDWLPHVGSSWDTALAEPPSEPGPSVTRVYNIEKALNRIAAVEKKDDARREISWSVVGLLRAGTGRYEAFTNEWAKKQFSLDDVKLTVKAPLNVQAEIARNLSAREQSGLGQTTIEARFITDERDIASKAGISWQYLEAFSANRDEDRPAKATIGMPVVRAQASVDDYLPVAMAVLTEKQVSRLHAAQSSTGANVVYSPKVTVLNGQLASIFDGTQRPFVVGVQDGGVREHRPKIALVDEGLKLTLRAIQSADGKKVQLEGRLELSEIGDARTASAVLRGKPETIQIPRVKRRRIDVSTEMPDGQSLLVACIPTFEEKRFFYLLLTVRNIVWAN